MRLTFIGRSGLGGVQMRGVDVARVLGAAFYDWKRVPSHAFDTVIVVKYWDAETLASLHQRCQRLILDPLDVWTQTRPHDEPEAFWRWCQSETRCDAMIATSPAMQESMNAAGVKSILIPHHADPRIEPDWYDAAGPVVYAGGLRFLGDARPRIEAACKRLNRRFVAADDRSCWQSLRGAGLALSVRLGEERTPLNVQCKPAVKIANAAAAGVPVLCTDDPAITSLCDVPTIDGDDWETAIALALESGPPRCPHSLTAIAQSYLEIDS